MKKLLSVILSVAMVMSIATFNAIETAAVVHGEYTTIDLTNSSAVTSKAFLSETTAGTITDAKYPDFFMGNGIGKAYAVSKESMDKLLVDGTLTYKGIPFKVNSADNQKVAIGCTSNKVEIPVDNYSKIHVLLVGSPDYTGDNTIYRGALTPSGVEIGTNRIADEFVADLEWAKVTPNDDFTGKDKPKLVMQTYEINDKTKVFDRVSFWMNSDASRRIIAVTVEGLSGEEWNPILSQKLSALPEADSYTDADYDVYSEVDKLVRKAEESGADVSTITGIEKYNQIKEKIKKLSENFTPVNLTNSSAVTSKAYLSETTAGTITDAAYPDFFMTGSAGTPYAIRKESMDKLLVDGTLTYKGIPFNVNTADNEKVAIGSTGNKVQIPEGKYTKVHVLYTGSNPDYITIYRSVLTPNGTEVGINRIADEYVADLEWEKVTPWDDINGRSKPKLKMQTYEVTDTSRIYDRISFWIESNAPIRILAVTVEKLDEGKDWNQIISEKIAELPEANKYTYKYSEKVSEIDTLIEEAKNDEFDINTIDGIDKYNNIKNQQKIIAERQVPLDLTANYNAIGYLSQDKAGTYQTGDESLKYPNFFMNSGGAAAVPSALSKESIDAFAINGKAVLGGVIYNLPAPADGQKGVINCETFGKINIPEDYYSEVKVLMVYGRTGGGNNEIFPSFYYSDGSKATYTKTERTVEKASWTNVLTTDNVNETAGLIEISYTFNEKDKKLDMLGVYTLPDSILRCLAITLVKGDNNVLDDVLSSHLSDMPSVENLGIQAYLKLMEVSEEAEKLGSTSGAENLPGLSKYSTYMAKIDELASGDEIVLNVDDDGDDNSLSTAPVKTLEKAKEIVKALKGRYPEKAYRVVFNEGEYRFSNGITFDTSDSGTPDKPIIYEGAEGANVIFKGSKEISLTNMEPVGDDIKALLKEDVKDKVYKIDLRTQGIEEIPAFSSSTWLEAKEYVGLYLDGKEQPIAQFPNGDGKYSIWESVIDPGEAGSNSKNGATIKVSDEEIKRWGNAKDFWVGGYFARDYRYERVNGKSIDAENMTITFAKGTDATVSSDESRRWKIYNLIEELDMPGEWYIDRENLILYYYPPKNITNGTFEISTLADNFITMTETQNVIFKNIEFAQSKADAISMGKDVKNIKITNCSFENLGRAGIRTYGSVTGSFEGLYNYLDAPSFVEISDCNFYNLGSAAIFMYGGGNRETLTESRNKITNNYIEKVSQNRKCVAAITIEGGIGTTVSNNVIHNTPFQAINFFGNNHKIQYNELENVCNEATDAGAIYSGRSYVMRGNEVSYNFVHDYRVHDDRVPLEQTSAIYLDDLMSGVAINHNIIVNGNTGIHVSGGQDNDIENNIILKTDNVFYTGNPGNKAENIGDLDDVAAYVIETFPAWAEAYPDILKTIEQPGPPHRNVIRYTLSDKTPSIIDSFIKRGTIEENYVTTEDIFVNPALLDYRVKSNAPIATTLPGIPAEGRFDINLIGLQVSENRPDVNPLSGVSGEFSKHYPENNAMNVNPYNCTFMWEEAQYADSYKIVIATDSAMQNVVYEDEVYQNFCTVKNLDAGAGKYYWQVYAKNNLRQINSEFAAVDGVYSFGTKGAEWIYESDSKPYISVDLSHNYNEKVFMEEGKTETSGALSLNRTALDDKMEKSRNTLNVDGVVYKIADKSSRFDAVKTSKYQKTTVSLANEISENISFLATADTATFGYAVKVYYADNSFETVTFDIGAYNNTANEDGLKFIPDFKTGTVDKETGRAEMAGGYIYNFTIPTATDKAVSKIEFERCGDNIVYIMAITQVLPKEVLLSDGTTQYNMVVNSENEGLIKVISTLCEDETPVLTKSQDVNIAGEKEKLIKVVTPSTEENYSDVKIYMWSAEDMITPYSDRIIKEVSDEK